MTATDSSHLEPDIHASETGPTPRVDAASDPAESAAILREQPTSAAGIRCGVGPGRWSPIEGSEEQVRGPLG